MCTCIRSQLARHSTSIFSIILHWNQIAFQSHLALDNSVSRPHTIGVMLWHSEHYGHHTRKSTAHERLGDRPDPGTAGSRDPGEDERSGSTRLYWHPAPRRSAGATAFGEDREPGKPESPGGHPRHQPVSRRSEHGGRQTGGERDGDCV